MANAKQSGERKKKEQTLTQALGQLVAKRLVPDLTERAEDAGVAAMLRARHEQEKSAGLTADEYGAWLERTVEQVAAAWALSCVFVRTLEDRGLLDRRRLAGEGAEDSEQLFFELAPSLTARDYLLTVFREVAQFPCAADLLGPEHNLAWRLSPSNDAARAILGFFREVEADGALRWGFYGTDTRFLGDVYQDLSENARKRFALLQTPDFVEAFILDRTLEPAIADFGLGAVRVIDPTCGSGHFLLGAFERLVEHRMRAEPGVDVADHAVAAVNQIYGVDLNPFAVAIARFRLSLAFLQKTGKSKLRQAPRLPLHLVVADSLLHGATGENLRLGDVAEAGARPLWGSSLWDLEDRAAAEAVFRQKYHAVVGNPPYITCKDAALREQYRKQYDSAAGKFALAAPFTERFFQLAEPSGFVGLINANSFMKREFGKALIEKTLKHLDLTRVIDTSGAYIPGHGTPTVLLFGRNRQPASARVPAVLGKRGEPSTPSDPAQGLVWTSIAEHHGDIGFENDFVSVVDVERATFDKHPWSLGGGGAAELKEFLEERAEQTLGDVVTSIGFMAIMGEDDVYVAPRHVFERYRLPHRGFGIGEVVRDWALEDSEQVLFPYDDRWQPVAGEALSRWLWPYRRLLQGRLMFGKTQIEAGREWFEYRHVGKEKVAVPLSIAFAFVATHNHFVMDRGGKVFKQSAPIIKLPEDATEDDHLALLAYLNSSTACFWMKQVFHKKSSASQKHHADEARAAYEFAGTGLMELPVPRDPNERLATYARNVLEASKNRIDWLSGTAFSAYAVAGLAGSADLRAFLDAGWKAYDAATNEAAHYQEELDWYVYGLFGLAETSPMALFEGQLALGARPFEYKTGYDSGISARVRVQLQSLAAADAGPPSWKARRDASGLLALLESRPYKRMWRDTERNVDQAEFRTSLERDWLRGWALNAMEQSISANGTRPLTLRTLLATSQVGTTIAIASDFLGVDAQAIGSELTATSAVPYLAALRFADAGLAKHASWQETWDAQRLTDCGNETHTPLPPAYAQSDFRSPDYWRLRGKLDVPKERFISYPGLERDDDPSPLIGWAGWDHAQRARVLVELYFDRKDKEAWSKERLTPILGGLHELLPWVKQWHNEPDADGTRLGDSLGILLSEQLHELGLTVADLEAWRPPKKTKGTRKVTRAPKQSADAPKKKAAAPKKPRASRKKAADTPDGPADDVTP